MKFRLNPSTFRIILALSIFLLAGIIYNYFSQETLPPIKYRVALDKTWYPLQFYGKDENFTIFSQELLQAIATQQHFSVQSITIETEKLFSYLNLGAYDGILSSTAALAERSEDYLVSNPYYLLGPVLVVSKDSPIKSLEDLNGKTIGIIIDSQPLISLYKNTSINFINYDYNNLFKLIDDVNTHRIDGMILNFIIASEYTKNGIYKDQLKIVTNPLTKEGLCLIAKNTVESKKFIEKFNEGLKNVKKDGTYKKLLLKWELFNPIRN